MDEAREPQDARNVPGVPLLQYANVAEAGDALRGYRMVGIALLLYYCGAIVGTGISMAGYYRMAMGSWAMYLQPGLTALEAAVGLAGAACMIRHRRAGALLIMSITGLRAVLQCLAFLAITVTMRSASPGVFFSASSATSSLFQSAAIALLAYLFWDHCRKRAAWG